MNAIELAGCRPEPLIAYLQALGVFRLVHAQLDPSVTGRWDGDCFVLEGSADADDLVDFFLDRYAPTPMVSPWNSRGGFRAVKHEKGEKAVAAIEASTSERLASYRATIAAAREIWDLATAAGWIEDEKVTAKAKTRFVGACRAGLPDEAIDWIDAAAVMHGDELAFPILMGTGGNLGSGDLATNMMETIVELFDDRPKPRARSHEWLRAALFADQAPALTKGLIGQFAPLAAGGVNSWAHGDAPTLLNPWQMLLGMEGAVVFASGVARRLASDSKTAAMPFTVAPSRAGYAAAEGESLKGELWAPLWHRPMTEPELRRLIAEGRIEWRGRHASTGLDMAKATRALGVDRGLSSFTRYVFAERFGQSILSVPVDRIAVTERAVPAVALMAALDPWLSRLNRGELPSAIASRLRRIEDAQLRVVTSLGEPRSVLDLLVEVFDLEAAVALNSKLRDQVGPAPALVAADWLAVLDDGSPEFRLGRSVALQEDRPSGVEEWNRRWGAFRLFVRPVQASQGGRWLEWAQHPTEVGGLGRRPLAAVLTDVLMARSQRCVYRPVSDGMDQAAAGAGPPVAFDKAISCGAGDLSDFMFDGLDEAKLGRLIAACSLMGGTTPFAAHDDGQVPLVPVARALLAAAYHRSGLGRGGEAVMIRPRPDWPHRLVGGDPGGVLAEASIRLTMAGWRPGLRARSVAIDDPLRLCASLLIPLTPAAVARLTDSVCVRDPEEQAR